MNETEHDQLQWRSCLTPMILYINVDVDSQHSHTHNFMSAIMSNKGH